jgi:hypothetical protein
VESHATEIFVPPPLRDGRNGGLRGPSPCEWILAVNGTLVSPMFLTDDVC